MESPLEYPERSSGLFKLIERFGFEQDSPATISAAEFHQFCTEYLEWSERRDAALWRYLLTTPRLFRCCLPFSNRVYRVASEVVWYLDEVIVRDPLHSEITAFLAGPTDKGAANVLGTMRQLRAFKEVVESGYLLFSSQEGSPSLAETSPIVTKLTEEPTVRTALDQAVRFGLTRRPDSTGQECVVYDMRLDSFAGMGWQLPKPVTGTLGPKYIVGEDLPISSPETLAQILGHDPFEGIRSLYPREVARTLRATEVAASIRAAVLFDRPVDDVILSAAENLHSNRSVTAPALGVKLILPSS
jgi:hypothetical protein